MMNASRSIGLRGQKKEEKDMETDGFGMEHRDVLETNPKPRALRSRLSSVMTCAKKKHR